MAFFESRNVVKNVVNGVCIAAKVLGAGLMQKVFQYFEISFSYGYVIGMVVYAISPWSIALHQNMQKELVD